MAKKKKCNAIVHSVYMGDGIRQYYEKSDVNIYKGEEASVLRDVSMIAWKVVKTMVRRKWSDAVDAITRREPSWPPHSLFCSCNKCQKKHANYKKLLKG